MIAIIGTSDRPCWLAEACKILLLCCSILRYMGWQQRLHAVDSWHLLLSSLHAMLQSLVRSASVHLFCAREPAR